MLFNKEFTKSKLYNILGNLSSIYENKDFDDLSKEENLNEMVENLTYLNFIS